MLLSQQTRFLLRNDLCFSPFRKKGPPLPLVSDDDTLDIFSILEERVKAGTAVFPIKQDDVVQITKVEVLQRQGMAVLLFRRSDPAASPPVYEHRKTKKLRVTQKLQDEAEAISAHLFIDLEARELPYPTHKSVLEEVPGLGRSYIQALFRDVLRDYEYEYEDDHGEQKETHTLVTLGGVPSETVGDGIKGGGIKFIELVRPPRLDGLDIAGMVAHPERMRLTLNLTPERSLRAVKQIQTWANNHRWPRVRIQIKTDDDRTRVVDLAREADAADVLFVRAEHVATRNPMEQCTDEINTELVRHARRIFDAWG